MAHKKYPCPCCGYNTLTSKGHYDLCEVCFWEDDPLQREDPKYDGGANEMCLNKAKENYDKFGAVSDNFVKLVRKPREDELVP